MTSSIHPQMPIMPVVPPWVMSCQSCWCLQHFSDYYYFFFFVFFFSYYRVFVCYYDSEKHCSVTASAIDNFSHINCFEFYREYSPIEKSTSKSSFSSVAIPASVGAIAGING